MGIFDRVVKDAEEMALADPALAQQASQVADGQDMRARQLIGRQRGAQDQDQDQDGNDQDPDAGQGQDENEAW
jgi:hypothetical protein